MKFLEPDTMLSSLLLTVLSTAAAVSTDLTILLHNDLYGKSRVVVADDRREIFAVGKPHSIGYLAKLRQRFYRLP